MGEILIINGHTQHNFTTILSQQCIMSDAWGQPKKES